MIVRLDQTVYCLAYTNHRYKRSEYQLSFFISDSLRDEFHDMHRDQVGIECVKFEFCIADLIKKKGKK